MSCPSAGPRTATSPPVTAFPPSTASAPSVTVPTPNTSMPSSLRSPRGRRCWPRSSPTSCRTDTVSRLHGVSGLAHLGRGPRCEQPVAQVRIGSDRRAREQPILTDEIVVIPEPAEVAHEFGRFRPVLEDLAEDVRAQCVEEFPAVGEDVVLAAFDDDFDGHSRTG